MGKLYLQLKNEVEMLEVFDDIMNNEETTEEEKEVMTQSIIEAHTNSIEAIEKSLSFIDFLNSQSERLKNKAKEINNRAIQAGNIVERIKHSIKNYMIMTEKNKIEFDTHKLSFRKSTSTEVFDIELLSADFIIIEKKAKKSEIKKAIQAGEIIYGARLLKNKNLVIK